jgi:hypothetical protein
MSYPPYPDHTKRKIVMQTIKTAGKFFIIAGAIMLLAAPAMAGNGKGTASGKGAGTGTQTKSRLKDGSCLDAVEKNGDHLLLVGKAAKTGDRDGTPDRTRSKDGSCRDAIEVNDDVQLLTADRLHIKDMIKNILQDGSCQDEEA